VLNFGPQGTMGKAMRRSSQMLLILLALFAFGVFSGYLYSQNPDSCNYDTGSRGYLQSSQCWWESRLCNSYTDSAVNTTPAVPAQAGRKSRLGTARIPMSVVSIRGAAAAEHRAWPI